MNKTSVSKKKGHNATTSLRKAGKVNLDGRQISCLVCNATLKCFCGTHPHIKLNIVFTQSYTNQGHKMLTTRIINLNEKIINLLKKEGFYIPYE